MWDPAPISEDSLLIYGERDVEEIIKDAQNCRNKE
jgi:hypothetical protein